MRILFFYVLLVEKFNRVPPNAYQTSIDLRVTELVQTDINRPTYKEISNLRL